MSSFDNLLKNVDVPEMYKVKQTFSDDCIVEIARTVKDRLDASFGAKGFTPGSTIAIGVGSRGIANLQQITKAIVAWFIDRGAQPFIIPTMGSHGGGTAEGQQLVLEQLGITESSVGCPIRSTMETVKIGTLKNGLPIHVDSYADKADGIFVINRIKQHTGFTGIHESGLVKMVAIGLGKQQGADSCHIPGYGEFVDNMLQMTKHILASYSTFLGGLGLVENAYEKTCRIEAVSRENLIEMDAELIKYARLKTARIYTDSLDILAIYRMGKDISGAGMDPNITGRAVSPFKTGELECSKIGVLRLTEQSEGNATGVGIADIIPQSLMDDINFDYTYTNVITSTMLKAAFLPIVMPTDEAVIKCLVKTCNAGNRPIRMAFIRDTLTLDEIWVSKAIADEMTSVPECDVDDSPQKITFDLQGNYCSPTWKT